jgi:hypothetical protein
VYNYNIPVNGIHRNSQLSPPYEVIGGASWLNSVLKLPVLVLTVRPKRYKAWLRVRVSAHLEERVWQDCTAIIVWKGVQYWLLSCKNFNSGI